jgi:hypothetical protein
MKCELQSKGRIKMAQYDDLYLRNTLNDTGNIPRKGAMSSSPDIIPWGLDPQPDPKKYFTDNYTQDVGKPLIADFRNYLYIRAKNLGNVASSGEVFLYWSPSSLLLYPSQWKVNSMKTSSGAGSVSMKDVAPSGIGVAEDAFTWSPSMPGGNFHYCLIGRVATDRHPNPIPNTGDIKDFAAWVAENGGIGWRNVSVVNAGAPTLALSTNYDQGPSKAEVTFAVTCDNCPIGKSWVSFSSATVLPDSQQPVFIPKTLIDQQGKVIGVKRQVPAGWNTTFTINYWSDVKPPEGWNIALEGTVTSDDVEDKALYKLGHTAQELGWGNGIHVAENGELAPLVQVIGPKHLIVVGQCVARHGNGV